jgi:ribosomal protein S5
MVKVRIEGNGSVPYNTEAKYKAAKVMVHQASE